MLNSSIWPIDRTLSSATTPSQSGPESNGKEGVLHIPQNSSITGASLSDCLVSYPEQSLMGWGLTTLQRCSQGILQPQPAGLWKMNKLAKIMICKGIHSPKYAQYLLVLSQVPATRENCYLNQQCSCWLPYHTVLPQ